MLLPARVGKLSAAETARRLERAYMVMPELKELAPRRWLGVGRTGQDGGTGPRADCSGTKFVILDEHLPGPRAGSGQRYAEALRRLRAHDPDIAILITESNPKLLEAFAIPRSPSSRRVFLQRANAIPCFHRPLSRQASPETPHEPDPAPRKPPRVSSSTIAGSPRNREVDPDDRACRWPAIRSDCCGQCRGFFRPRRGCGARRAEKPAHGAA